MISADTRVSGLVTGPLSMNKLVTIMSSETDKPLCTIGVTGPSAYCALLQSAKQKFSITREPTNVEEVRTLLDMLFDNGRDTLWSPVHDPETGLLDLPVEGVLVSGYGIFPFWSYLNVHQVEIDQPVTVFAAGSGAAMATGYIEGYIDACVNGTDQHALHQYAHRNVARRLLDCAPDFTFHKYKSMLVARSD